MRLFRLAVAGLAIAIAMPSMQLSADIVLDFEDDMTVFDSGANPDDSEDRTDTDLLGVVGVTSVPFLDLTTGLSTSITTVDIIGADLTSAAAGTGTADFHETNILGSGLFGINSDTDIDDDLTNDAGNFNPGEAWVFSFDNLVELRAIGVNSFDADEQIVTISGEGFDTITLSGTEDQIDFEDVLIAANTAITLQFVSTTDDDTFQLDNLTFGVLAPVTGEPDPSSVPEPSSLALLGLGSLVFARRRR